METWETCHGEDKGPNRKLYTMGSTPKINAAGNKKMVAFVWHQWNNKDLQGPLTCGLLCEHDFGLGGEVLSRENHLLAPVDQAAVDILSLHHGQLVGGSLGCGQEDKKSL